MDISLLVKGVCKRQFQLNFDTIFGSIGILQLIDTIILYVNVNMQWKWASIHFPSNWSFGWRRSCCRSATRTCNGSSFSNCESNSSDVPVSKVISVVYQTIMSWLVINKGHDFNKGLWGHKRIYTCYILGFYFTICIYNLKNDQT